MNKLLVSVLVLGLVSTASATPKELRVAVGGTLDHPTGAPVQGDYIYPVDSEFSILPSETLWIGVYNTTPGGPGDNGQDSMFLIISDNGSGEWTGNANIYVPPGLPGMYNEYLGFVEGFGDFWLLQMTDGIPDHYVDVGVVDATEFHCLGIGDVVVELYDYNVEQDNVYHVDSFIIHQIPEPMTIALLGLGGLLLRRSRR